ncbi:MAG: hypothetical protein ABSA59_08565 [Terriglobia bacterium]|jgi:hypothetical protein
MTGYVMQIANRQRTNCLLIEDVLWGDLEREERQVLLGHFLVMGVKARAQMAILRVLGYADIEPFVAARFLPTPRVFHAYLTLWSGQLPVEELSSMYIDVV